MTALENRIIQYEAIYLGAAHGGFNYYSGGHLSLHDKYGPYVFTYPKWSTSTCQHQQVHRYVVTQRLKYEMQLLPQETMAGGGSCTVPYDGRPAICNANGYILLDRTDLVLGSVI